MHRTLVPVAIALLALAATPALADSHEGSGGKASEHRSDKAAEKSNAQWSEGATKGEERAERRELEAPDRAAKETKKAGDKVLDKPQKEKREAVE
jgi:hypothetical protein